MTNPDEKVNIAAFHDVKKLYFHLYMNNNQSTSGAPNDCFLWNICSEKQKLPRISYSLRKFLDDCPIHACVVLLISDLLILFYLTWNQLAQFLPTQSVVHILYLVRVFTQSAVRLFYWKATKEVRLLFQSLVVVAFNSYIKRAKFENFDNI